MIKALLYKDIKNIKPYALTMLIISILLCFILNEQGFSVVLSVLASGLVFTSFSLDDTAGHTKEEVAIIGNRKIIVEEKYLFALMVIALGAIESFLVECILGLLSGCFSASFSLSIAIQSLSMGALVCAIAIPFIIRLGSEKARIITFFFIFAPILFSSLIQNIADKETLISGFIPLFFIVTAIVVAPLSYFISVRLFKDKEL